jgi:chemotaxis protein histidine kinase CheA
MVHDPFAALRQEYLANAEQRLADLERLGTLAATDADARVQLRRLAHNLRGSGGFYGFHQISAAATSLEELLLGDTFDVLSAAQQLCQVIRDAAQKPQGPS